MEKGIHIFSVSIVIVPTRLLCQMQANSSRVEFYQPYPRLKFMKRMNFVIACWGPSQNMKLGIFTVSRAVDDKEMYKKVWCKCKVVVLPCQAIAFLTFSSPPHLQLRITGKKLRYIVMSHKKNILGANWIAPVDSIPNVFFDSSVDPSFLLRTDRK